MPSFDLISDLHLDLQDNPMQMLIDMEPLSDMLMVAGDLCEARNIREEWIDILSAKYEIVYYVPGNHEYYGSTKAQTLKMLRDAMTYNVYLLNAESLIYDGLVIAGNTLWFPDGPGNSLHEWSMNDFSSIIDFKSWVYAAHETAKAHLSNSYCDVWLTHHLPLWKSVPRRYIDSPTNCFFVGDLSKELQTMEYPPKVIVHGHTHEACDYMAGDTRVVCNPLGYPNEGRQSILPVRIEL